MKQIIRHYGSPLGGITLSFDEEALTDLWFDGQKHFPLLPLQDDTGADLRIIADTVRWLDIYFSGKDPGFVPALRMNGTVFQQRVWKILCEIPYGHTMTYKEIAGRIAREDGRAHMSAQAVGSAVSRNPISLIVPCHRVIGSDGSLTGYAGGTDRKKALLASEGIPVFR